MTKEGNSTAEIRLRKLQSDSEKVQFDCGISSINEMIKKSYYPTILQHLYTFEILVGKTTVGYYMFGFRRIKLSECPESIEEYRSDMSEYCYSLHIRYFAVDKEYQHLGIGTAALKMFIRHVRELCKIWPIRLITIDALKERVEWYENKGFAMFDASDMRNAKASIGMYLDCITDPDKVEEYRLQIEGV